MNSLSLKTAPALFVLLALSVTTGCEEKGPAQKAGQSVDRAAEKAKDAIDPPGPVEKAGRAVDKTVNK